MPEPPLMPEWAWNFGGVVTGALIAGLIGWFTAWKLHQWETERTKKTISIALYAELELLLQAVDGLIKTDGDPLTIFLALGSLEKTTLIYRQNTDKIGLFGDISRELVGAYQSMIFWISRGCEYENNFTAVKNDAHLRDATVNRLRSNAAEYIEGLKEWAIHTRDLHNRLGLMCDIGTTRGKHADRNDG